MSYLFPDLKLPWSSSQGEDKKFFVFATAFVVLSLLLGIIIQSITLPEQSREELAELPPQLAKVMLRKKEEPKPKPKPKVEEPKPKEEPKPEEKPKPKVEEPKSEPKPQVEKPKPTEKQIKKAREKASKSGVLAMKDDLAALRQSFSMPAAPKGLSTGGAKATEVKRSVIMGNATATSGGIRTSGAPGVSNIAALDAKQVTQVDSVSLGSTQVDAGGTGGGIEKASGKVEAGQRGEEKIRMILDQNKGALYAIYNRALREDPALKGRVTFELTIEPDGSVSKVKIVSSDLGNAKLERRLSLRMQMINFGEAKVSRVITRWALDFLPY